MTSCMANGWELFAGKLSDRDVSRRFDIGASTVRRYRLKHGIATYNPQNIDFPEALLEQLGTVSNYKLAQDFKIPTTHISGLRGNVGVPEPKVKRPRGMPLENGVWTSETIALLGTMPDPELADRLGVSRFPVKEMRKQLGIAPFQNAYPETTKELAAEFGMVSDSVLAKRLGVSTSFIRRARLKWLKNTAIQSPAKPAFNRSSKVQ